MGIGKKYLDFYLSTYSTLKREDFEELSFLRNKLFCSILIWAFPFSVVSYILSIWVSLVTGSWVIALFDSLAMALLTYIYFARSISLKVKKLIFSALFYMLAVVLFVYLGTSGPSVVILFCLSILITLFHDRKAGFISLAVNSGLYLLFLATAPVNLINIHFFGQLNVYSWIGISVNLIVFNALAVVSVASLVSHLTKSFLREKQLQILLKKESESLRLAKQKAEESDRLKSAFLANLSHEIRTPMNGIMGFSSLLSEENVKESDRQMYLELIQKNGERMLNTINQIVDLSKIQSGVVTFHSSRENLNKMMTNIFDFLETEASRKGLAFSFHPGLDDPEAHIYADCEKLSIIMTNLVKNAVKFTDEGEVSFGYEIVPANNTGSGTELVFFVKDTGIGIPQEKQSVVFDRFMNIDEANLKVRDGAGLSLFISKNFVELMGGKIWLESEEKGGSTFFVSLPFTPGT